MGPRLAMTRVFLMAPQIVSHLRGPRAGGDPDLRSAHDRLVLIWTPAFAGDAAAGEGDILVLRRAAPRNDAGSKHANVRVSEEKWWTRQGLNL